MPQASRLLDSQKLNAPTSVFCTSLKSAQPSPLHVVSVHRFRKSCPQSRLPDNPERLAKFVGGRTQSHLSAAVYCQGRVVPPASAAPCGPACRSASAAVVPERPAPPAPCTPAAAASSTPATLPPPPGFPLVAPRNPPIASLPPPPAPPPRCAVPQRARSAPLLSTPTRCGIRESLPAHPAVPKTPGSHPHASAPDPPSGTAAIRTLQIDSE